MYAPSRHQPLALLLALLVPFGWANLNVHAPSRMPETQTMIDRRFDVEPGDALRVQVGDADLVVETMEAPTAHVEVMLEARDMDKARRYFEMQHFRVEQRGDAVIVTSDPEENAWRTIFTDWRDHPRILVRVRVPESFDADLRTSDGDITIGRMSGTIRAHSSDGDLEVAKLTGTVELKTSDGDILTDVLDGETIVLQTSDGDIVLADARAATLTARTSDGDIRAGRMEGDVEARTSDGDIRIDVLHGASCRVHTSDGAITIGELVIGGCEVRTSDGEITLDHVEGDLTASASDADMYVHVFKPGRISLQTTDGDIDIVAPMGLPAELYLRGDRVWIDSAFDFEGQLDEERAEGRLGPGGPRLEARTSEGAVTLRPR